MDEKDYRILAALAQNSRQSLRNVAKTSDVSLTTAHHRIEKLEKEGVIKKYTIEPDYNKLGLPMTSFILVNVDDVVLKQKNIDQHDLSKQLLKFAQVEEVAVLTGEYDLMIRARFPSVIELDEFLIKKLRGHPGVLRTQTIINLRSFSSNIVLPDHNNA